MLDRRLIAEVVGRALAEDAPWGDLTGAHVIPAEAIAQAHLVARADGVLAGAEVVTETFRQADDAIEVILTAHDGDRIEAGQRLATVHGPARGVLAGERVALNFAQRMSGIATTTARYVAAVAGTGARIADTRKTAPGLRAFDKHAVLAGGGSNHRFSLSDAVMLKDNHLAVLAAGGQDLAGALLSLRRRLGHTTHVEVEVDTLDQLDMLDPALEAGAVDSVLLDNVTLDELAAGVDRIGRRAVVEASGTVGLDEVADVARTGVDVISVGALTHSVSALDLGLDLVVDA